jgi:hypothetical protein
MPPLAPLPIPQAPPQQLSTSTPWFKEWDLQSLIGSFSSTEPALPTPVTNWVVESGATNHTTPYHGHIYSPSPPSFTHPSSIVVGNGSVLPVTLVGDTVLPGPFYLNNVLIVPNLV